MSQLQINLLPDVKLKYLAQAKSRKLIVDIAVTITSLLVVVFILTLVTVYGIQKQQLSSAGKAVENARVQLQNVKNLDKVLTVQNQLQSLVSFRGPTANLMTCSGFTGGIISAKMSLMYWLSSQFSVRRS